MLIPQRVPTPPSWSADLTSVGITGTDGKTSCVRMAAAALATLRSPVAEITSIGAFVGGTRSDVDRNYAGLLATMRSAHAAGGRYAVVEWASWSLARGLLQAWPCRIGAVTNVTRDHLDDHGSYDAYLESKAQIVRSLPPDGTAVLNVSDQGSATLKGEVPHGVKLVRYGRPEDSAGRPLDLELIHAKPAWTGTEVSFRWCGTPRRLRLSMIGAPFAENALCALAVSLAAGAEIGAASAAISGVPSPPGRFEPLQGDLQGGPRVVIDFAHTPQALRRTIATARALTTREVVLVFGAGGDRDRGKRPLMGQAAEAADRVLVTSDNPRTEEPLRILDDIVGGMGGRTRPEREPNRRRAIEIAIAEAQEGDVIVIAGRGRDTHQIVGTEWQPMDDAQVARDAISARPRRRETRTAAHPPRC